MQLGRQSDLGLPHLLHDGSLCGYAVQEHGAAKEGGFAQVSKKKVRIGEGRPSSAATVTSRARLGSVTLSN
jgi:hypothetical protein